MTRWNKGDPYPEDWPDWLRRADIEWCHVKVHIEGRVTWHDGVWHEGVWRDGNWHNGTWLSGSWRCGTWHGGVWVNGHWNGGRWKQGLWKYGVWSRGVWEDGVWEGGLQLTPRFGWEQGLSVGTLRGYYLGFWRERTPEEWETYLNDMEPEKVDEFYTLLSWIRLKERREAFEGPRTSVWGHIEDEI